MQRYHAPEDPPPGAPRARPGGVPLLAVLGVAGAVAAWRRWRPFRAAVEGDSMRPSLEPGDFLVATAGGRIRRGSLVVLARPDRPQLELVKRIAGLPGDLAGGHRLGPHEYWVLGDQATLSTDSRTFGPVPAANLRGVVRARYWPAGRLGVVR